MKDTVDYNAGLNTDFTMEIPKDIVEKVQKQGFPSPYDELEEVSRQAKEFYLSKGDLAKVSEVENFRDYLLDMEDENF